MSWLGWLAGPPKRNYRLGQGAPERILVVRLNRMGDMISTLPLIWALREFWPDATLDVATEAAGLPVARMCPAIDHVVPLTGSGSRWQRYVLFAWKELRDYDVVIAAKGGYNGWLGRLVRMANAPVRIGFEHPVAPSGQLTHPAEPYVHLPGQPHEHQVDTLLRLLDPLSVPRPPSPKLSLAPSQDISKAMESRCAAAFGSEKPYLVLNLSSTSPQIWTDYEYAAFLALLNKEAGVAVALAFAPKDEARAEALSNGSTVQALPCTDTEELAALIAGARAVVTPEGGVSHLAAALQKPTLVLWWQGPYEKWRPLNEHALVLRADQTPQEATPAAAFALLQQLRAI